MPERRDAPSLPDVWSTAAAVFWKDLVIEARRRQLLAGMLVFAVLILFIFNFALDLQVQLRAELAAGILWAAVIFSGAVGFQYSATVEQQSGCMDGIRLAPVRRSWIYLGKLLANLAFLLLMEALLLPAGAILFSVNLFHPLFLLVLVLGTIGYSAAGTLFASMSSRTATREMMLPLLLFPLVVPLLIPAVQAGSSALQGEPYAGLQSWVNLLIGYDMLLLAASALMFEYVIEE